MGKDLIVGMSIPYIMWSAAIMLAGSRLIVVNIQLYQVWWTLERNTRVKMALWLAIPLLMLFLVWTRIIGVIGLVNGSYVSQFGVDQAVTALPVALTALALSLWWACDRALGMDKGDRVWCWIMWVGVAVGTAGMSLSLVFRS